MTSVGRTLLSGLLQHAAEIAIRITTLIDENSDTFDVAYLKET